MTFAGACSGQGDGPSGLDILTALWRGSGARSLGNWDINRKRARCALRRRGLAPRLLVGLEDSPPWGRPSSFAHVDGDGQDEDRGDSYCDPEAVG